jgi:uncharacterized protein YdeI (YjbR/CyaY-like superfamily)
VWLILYKRHSGEPTVSYNEAVEEALCFGWIDGLRRSIDDRRYAKRFSPRRAESLWSALNKARVRRMTDQGLMTKAGMAAIAAAKKSGKWNETPVGRGVFKTPPELKSELARNEKATRFFDSLAPSYRAQFVRWVASAKREETRERRAREAVALLARGEKLGMK